MSDSSNYDQIRQQIQKRYDKRAEFVSHTIAFIIVNALLWAAWLITDSSARMSAMIPIAITGLWFVGFAIHTVQHFMWEASERAIDRAIREQREWEESRGEKRKRSGAPRKVAHLTDDGELLEVVDEDEPESAAKYRR
jgi:hypothetical protein